MQGAKKSPVARKTAVDERPAWFSSFEVREESREKSVI
jgi:hypothetical protein